MLCERCKVREANIRYTEVINGVAAEHNLCSQCAKEMDFGQHTGIAGIFDSELPIGKLLSQLLGLSGAAEANQPEEVENLVCPTCQTSYGDFVKNSQFGCPDCYHMFDLLISDKLKQLHGSDTHKGKSPAGQSTVEEETPEVSLFEKPLTTEERIQILHSKLQEAISEEDYEAAAQYRDEIRALERGQKDEQLKGEAQNSKTVSQEDPQSEDTAPQQNEGEEQ
ncbi:MAG: UvrB/UvrC motif-containing protein [Lachnospiraceae bacterium]|nr:UvrB/UvrC motif-containing protein [Lachnospiraceae bacterium]